MAKRQIQNSSGAIGEANVLGALLRTGAAVNALTGDDTGWDLHMHLPTKPLDPPLSERGKQETWELSGLVVHVQVKAREGRTVSVPKTTVDGWIAGSRSGAPTFVIVVDSKEIRVGEESYEPKGFRIDPHEMDTRTESKTGNVSLTARPSARFDWRTFAYLADLWAHHGPLMMEIGGEVETLASAKGALQRDAFTELASLLVEPALPMRTTSAEDGGELARALADVIPIVVNGLDKTGEHSWDDRENAITVRVSDIAPIFRGEWGDSRVAPWLISKHRDWSWYQEDLADATRRIGEYIDACRKVAKKPSRK